MNPLSFLVGNSFICDTALCMSGQGPDVPQPVAPGSESEHLIHGIAGVLEFIE